MRSHAKAPSAGPTLSRGLLALLAVIFAGTMLSASASAALTRLPTAFSPINGSGTGVTFHQELSSLAVDTSTGNLFVGDAQFSTKFYVTDIFGPEGGHPSGVAAPYQTASGQRPGYIAIDNSSTSPPKETSTLGIRLRPAAPVSRSTR